MNCRVSERCCFKFRIPLSDSAENEKKRNSLVSSHETRETVVSTRGKRTKRHNSPTRRFNTFFNEPIQGLFWGSAASRETERRVDKATRGVDRRGSIEDRRRVRASIRNQRGFRRVRGRQRAAREFEPVQQTARDRLSGRSASVAPSPATEEEPETTTDVAMCGIFAYCNYGTPTKQSVVVDKLLNGLRRLEYRGYDSAGIAVDNGPSTDQLAPIVMREIGKIVCAQLGGRHWSVQYEESSQGLSLIHI